jgi:transcriptional regulator with XRE-family HTH domain
MQLDEWMRRNGKTYQDVADALGVDDVTIGRYARGERRPRWDVLTRLVEVTGGDVTANDFLPPPEQAAPEAPPPAPDRAA